MFYFINSLLLTVIFLFSQQVLHLDPFNPFVDGVRLREFRNDVVTAIQFVLPIILSIGMSVALKMNDEWHKKELQVEKIKESQLDAELKYLRYQVQPHFLFNTLNNIYSLVESSPSLAKKSIHSLSKMMRYLLDDSAMAKVPLAKEIEFLERYIDLMQMRVSANLSVEKNLPVLNRPIQIAPLLLLSFIENAFKHGIDAVKASHIKIELRIEENTLSYCVTNSAFPKAQENVDSGIGLENLKKRLELLYPDNYELLAEQKGDIYISKLTLKLMDRETE